MQKRSKCGPPAPHKVLQRSLGVLGTAPGEPQERSEAIPTAVALVLHYDAGIAIAMVIVLLWLLLEGFAIALVLYYDSGLALALAVVIVFWS